MWFKCPLTCFSAPVADTRKTGAGDYEEGKRENACLRGPGVLPLLVLKPRQLYGFGSTINCVLKFKAGRVDQVKYLKGKAREQYEEAAKSEIAEIEVLPLLLISISRRRSSL